MEVKLNDIVEKQFTEEDKEKITQEFQKQVDEIKSKFTIVDAEKAETIEVENVTEDEAREIYETRDELFAFTEISDGLGLSASQLGIPKKYFVARDMKDEENKFTMYFNPRYYPNSKSRITFKEGCLTYPGIELAVKRYKSIYFQWDGFDKDGNWKHFKKTIGGLNSIIIQHETMHCAGHPGSDGKTPETIMTLKRKKGNKKSNKDYIK